MTPQFLAAGFPDARTGKTWSAGAKTPIQVQTQVASRHTVVTQVILAVPPPTTRVADRLMVAALLDRLTDMPCYDSRDNPESVRHELMESFTHNSPVAELLCEATRIIREAELQDKMSPELKKWIVNHQIRDAAILANNSRFLK